MEIKTAIYTAIVEGYDDLPQVEKIEPDIDYICFSDDDITPSGPWQIRKFVRVFADPQREARRVKLLPHLFLAEYTHSLWLDATVKIVDCTASFIRETTQSGPIACIRHLERDCLYEEADVVLGFGVDNPGVVRRQLAKYAALGVPPHGGLHMTTIMFREHHHPLCKRFSHLWWAELSSQSKRDQLSFDFVRWLLDCSVNNLPHLIEEGNVLGWGERHYWHKASSFDRFKYKPIWAHPSLAYNQEGIYEEQEAPRDFLVAAQNIMRGSPPESLYGLPIVCSNGAYERESLAMQLAEVEGRVLFLGAFSSLWVLWARCFSQPSIQITWVWGSPSDATQTQNIIAEDFPQAVSFVDKLMHDFVNIKTLKYLSRFELVVLAVDFLDNLEQLKILMDALPLNGAMMLFGNGDLLETYQNYLSLSWLMVAHSDYSCVFKKTG